MPLLPQSWIEDHVLDQIGSYLDQFDRQHLDQPESHQHFKFHHHPQDLVLATG